MKLHVICVTLLCASFSPISAYAQVISAGLSGAALRQKLRDDYSPTRTLTYNDARQQMFSTIDNIGGIVECVYTGERVTTRGIPANSVMNTEHTWPQSKFGRTARQMKVDLHHLYPTLSKVNSSRGNKPFADILDSQTEDWWITDTSQTGIPRASIDSYSEATDSEFEPREIHKGNVARSLLYFYCIYENQGIGVSWLTPQIPTLLNWHTVDPVDASELARTNAISAVQGNTNPFILDPTLAVRSVAVSSPAGGALRPNATTMLRRPNNPSDAEDSAIDNRLENAISRLENLIEQLEAVLDRQ